MKRKGGNGTVYIDKEKNIAIKTLSNPKNLESKQRFMLEMQVLRRIQKESRDSIVEILDINEENMTITMRAYETSLTSVYDKTKGNVYQTIQMILPIVNALKELSELDTPIYHRDIKPQNILVDNMSGDPRLVLSDFGCAYMQEEDNRLTDDFRAVGAQLYRAPEYQHGRVDEVDEKGDIFSIGKIIWNLFNGNEKEVFPYTLWFPKEYNLCNRFPNNVELLKLNNLIGACTNYDKNRRPSYRELIMEMENILNCDTKEANDILKQKAIEFEANRMLIDAENREKVNMFLTVYLYDFQKVMKGFEEIKLEILEKMMEQHNRFFKNAENIKRVIITNGQEVHMINLSFQGVYFQISYRPRTDVTELACLSGVDSNLPYIYAFYGGGHLKRNDMRVFFKNGILYCKTENGKIKKYDSTTWNNYMNEFVSDYVK